MTEPDDVDEAQDTTAGDPNAPQEVERDENPKLSKETLGDLDAAEEVAEEAKGGFRSANCYT